MDRVRTVSNLVSEGGCQGKLLSHHAHLAEWPRMREEEVEALRWLETRQVRKNLFRHARKFDKLTTAVSTTAVSQPAQLPCLTDLNDVKRYCKQQLQQQHREPREEEKEEHACTRV